MRQMLMAFAVDDSARAGVTRELTRRGYAVSDARRMVGNLIHIRVREDTDDRAEVSHVVTAFDPIATRLPDGVPPSTVRGYREGQ